MSLVDPVETLHHAEAMTRHRDQSLVDAALVTSLTDLLGRGRRRVSVSIFRIEFDYGKYHVTRTAWSDGREADYSDIACLPDDLAPEVMRAVEDGSMRVTDVPEGRGTAHCCWFPVVSGDKVLACVETRLNTALNPKKLEMINGMLGLYRNYLSLLEYSQNDSLTGLLNRKTFDDNLEKLLARSRRELELPEGERRQGGDGAGSGDWLAIIDIDHFKRINDNFGHIFGDEVLILMSRLMRKIFRRYDKLFRFGGEEFVVIAQQTSEDNAYKVFERFRNTVESHDFPQVGKVTVSIGYTRVRPGDSNTTLLGRADSALYYAKEHGRNRVFFHEQLVSRGELHSAHLNTELELF